MQHPLKGSISTTTKSKKSPFILSLCNKSCLSKYESTQKHNTQAHKCTHKHTHKHMQTLAQIQQNIRKHHARTQKTENRHKTQNHSKHISPTYPNPTSFNLNTSLHLPSPWIVDVENLWDSNQIKIRSEETSGQFLVDPHTNLKRWVILKKRYICTNQMQIYSYYSCIAAEEHTYHIKAQTEDPSRLQYAYTNTRIY